MSKDHEGHIKQYILLSEAWYADANLKDSESEYVDDVTFGFYAPGDGTSGEMSVKWIDLSRSYIKDDKHIAPRLECFCDAWHTLAQFKDVIDAMAERDGENITPKEFCKILARCGFTDRTPRKYEDSYPERSYRNG